MLISDEEISFTHAEKIYYCNLWKKLKRGGKEMLDVISESADMNPKDFTKNLGMEIDEDYSVDVLKIWD